MCDDVKMPGGNGQKRSMHTYTPEDSPLLCVVGVVCKHPVGGFDAGSRASLMTLLNGMTVGKKRLKAAQAHAADAQVEKTYLRL
jgi:hypothetical protein